MSEQEYTIRCIDALINQGEATRETLAELLKEVDNEEYSEEFIAALIRQLAEDWCAETIAAENGVQRALVKKHRETADQIIEDCKSEKFHELTGLDGETFINMMKEMIDNGKDIK